MASGCPAAGVHKMLQRGDSKMSLSGSFKVGAVGDAEMFQVEPAIFVATSQMRTCWNIYLQNSVIFGVSMLVNIPAPWSIWVG